MSKSLFYQFNSALDMCFVLHFDKHSDKHNPQSESDHIIKSLSAKSNLKDFAHDFAAFIKSEYGVKQVKEITPDMCQSYIERKSAENCSLKTIKTYQSNLLKLQKCASRAFHIPRLDFSVSVDESKIEKTETIKQYSFTRAEMEKILAAPRSCDSLTALKFAYQTGVRVNSLERLEVRHIDFKNGITIHKDKGNRTRVLPMSEETAKLLREQIKGKNPQDKVFGVKKGSVNRYLRRRCEKLNICTPNGDVKSGVHGIRKLWAEQFAEKNGVAKTMVALGHGEDRKDLEDTYLHSKK